VYMMRMNGNVANERVLGLLFSTRGMANDEWGLILRFLEWQMTNGPRNGPSAEWRMRKDEWLISAY
jgi:hypothetical protein